MGATIRFDDRLLGRALAASIVLHLLVALFLPLWTPPESSGLQPIEALSFAHLMRVEIQRPKVAALPSAIPKTATLAKRVTLARSHAEIAAKTHRRRNIRSTQTAASDSEKAAAPQHRTAHSSQPLIAQAPASDAPSTNVSMTSSQRTPEPESSDSRSVQSSGAADRGGVLPPGYFSAPVLDPGIRTQLQKITPAHVTLTVVVGEDGKTKSVAFAPPLDATTQDAIRQLLEGAAWDPAVCGGGVSCEGTAVIRL